MPIVRATVFTNRVLANPGTPSSSRWPPVKRAIKIRSTTTSCPTTTLATRVRMSRINDVLRKIIGVFSVECFVCSWLFRIDGQGDYVIVGCFVLLFVSGEVFCSDIILIHRRATASRSLWAGEL